MIISIQKDAADRTGLGSNKRKLVKDKDNAKWFTENVLPKLFYRKCFTETVLPKKFYISKSSA